MAEPTPANTLRVSVVASRYAQALIDLAQQAGTLPHIGAELTAVTRAWQAHPELLRMFSGYLLSVEKREAVLKTVFQGRISNLLYHFLQVLNQKNRMLELPTVTLAFTQAMDRLDGRLRVTSTSAVAMDASLTDELSKHLTKVLKQEVTLTSLEDARMIGGLKLKIGDTLYDASLATHLRQMRQAMSRSIRDKAQNFMTTTPPAQP